MASALVSAAIVAALSVSTFCEAFSPAAVLPSSAYSSLPSSTCLEMSDSPSTEASSSRRSFIGQSAALTLGALTASTLTPTVGGPAQAVGPVKILLENPVYKAAPCPPSRPIPGEKAMKGMRGLCVTVKADLDGAPDKVRDEYMIDICNDRSFISCTCTCTYNVWHSNIGMQIWYE